MPHSGCITENNMQEISTVNYLVTQLKNANVKYTLVQIPHFPRSYRSGDNHAKITIYYQFDNCKSKIWQPCTYDRYFPAPKDNRFIVHTRNTQNKLFIKQFFFCGVWVDWKLSI